MNPRARAFELTQAESSDYDRRVSVYLMLRHAGWDNDLAWEMTSVLPARLAK